MVTNARGESQKPQSPLSLTLWRTQATYAVEISKLELAWQLNCAAAAMCQTLGWHRLPAMQDETTDKKAGIFWFSYMLDKGLSLRFGRSSVIQDYDISMPRRVGRINVTDPWRTLLNLWIEHAELMGRSYEELYSPGAMARGPDQRLESARLLIDSIKGMIHQTDELALTVKKEHEASGPKDLDAKSWRDMTLECILKADQVSYWSSLTLIYRAIPIQAGMPSRFNTECIEAARLAFECHQECIELTSGNPFMMAGYLHWYEEIAFLSSCCERTLNPGVVWGCFANCSKQDCSLLALYPLHRPLLPRH